MAGPSLFRPSNISSGLQGFWKLDESSGNASDSSGNSNTLTDNNTVGANTENYWNLTSDGSRDFENSNSEFFSITDASQTGLDLTGSYSAAGWFKFETKSNPIPIMFKGFATEYSIGFDSNGVPRIVNVATLFQATTQIPVGKWTHVAWVYDTTNNIATFYIDGNVDAVVAATTDPNSGSGDFVLGKEGPSGSVFLDGLMKDVAIWNVVITSSQIKSLAMGYDVDTLAFRPDNAATTPSSFWKLNELSSGAGAVSRADSTGSNTLTDNNTVETAEGYVEGSGADFEAANSEFLSAGDVLDITGTYSMSCWFKPESVNITQVFIGKSDGTNGYQWGLNSSGKMFVQHEATTFNDTGTALTTGTWYHLFVTYDTVANEVKFFLDGTVNSTIAAAVDPTDTAINFNIGRRSATDNVDGILADVAIWTSTEISDANIASIASGTPLQQSGIVSYYKLDEANGSALDAIGSNNLTETSGTIGTAAGQVDQARDFELGDTEFFTITNASQTGLNITRDITFLGWINPESSTVDSIIVERGIVDANNGYEVDLTSSNVIRFNIGGSSSNGNITIADAAFGHFGCVHDGALRDIYTNGGIDVSTASTTLASSNIDSFLMGAGGSTPVAHFDGLLDEILIATRWFREEEIKTAFNKGNNAKETTSEEISSVGVSGITGFFAIL